MCPRFEMTTDSSQLIDAIEIIVHQVLTAVEKPRLKMNNIKEMRMKTNIFSYMTRCQMWQKGSKCDVVEPAITKKRNTNKKRRRKGKKLESNY